MRNFAGSGIFLSGSGNLRMELDHANRWLKSKLASSVLTKSMKLKQLRRSNDCRMDFSK